MTGNRNGLFRQVVYDDEHIIIPMLVPIKGVEVHGYVLLWAVWYWEWFEEARSLVLRAGSLPTRVTIAYILVYIS